MKEKQQKQKDANLAESEKQRQKEKSDIEKNSVEKSSTEKQTKSKKSSMLLKSLIVSSMTFISRILGLIRDIVIASFIGAGGAADAFLVAFKIPNFLRRLFAEGAFNQAFVPLLSEYATKKSEQALKDFIRVVSGNLALILSLVTLIGVLSAPLLVWVFAPGFSSDIEKMADTAEFLRFTFPYIWFISLTALTSSILNVRNNFAVPAFTPTLLNLSLICMAVFLSPYLEKPALALAFGVLLAGFLQLIFQLPFVAKQGLLVMPRLDWKDSGVKRLLKLMLPAIFGVSVSQINLLLDTVLASLLEDGSVSWLYYSDRLVELPLGIFAIAIATVILPRLSKTNAMEDKQGFLSSLDWGLKLVLLIGFPSMLGLILLANPLLISLFQYGAMTPLDIQMASKSLIAYSFGLLPFMLIKVLATGYFARQNTKAPVKFGIYAMFANMVFNLILIFPLAHTGLALATSLSAWLNAGFLFFGLKKDGFVRIEKDFMLFVLKILASIGFLFVSIILLNPELDFWLSSNFMQRSFTLTYIVIAGILVYFFALRIFGIKIKDFLKTKV